MNKRETWIDYSKTIGILLIVFGHLSNTVIVGNFLWTFHVPLFFFISGYLFKTQRGSLNFSRKLLSRLVIPYFVFYVSLELYDMYHAGFHNEEFWQSMKAMFYGSNVYPGFVRGQMWFFPGMIRVSILFFFVIHRFPYFYLILLGISVYLYTHGWLNTFLSLDLSLLGLNFYYAGYFFK